MAPSPESKHMLSRKDLHTHRGLIKSKRVPLSKLTRGLGFLVLQPQVPACLHPNRHIFTIFYALGSVN